MRERITNHDVVLKDINHKINRKAMIASAIRFYDFASDNSNWLYTEEMQRKVLLCEEAFSETVRTPVGGCVRRYIEN